MDEFDRLARLFGLIAVRAGEAIMNVRADATRPDYKADGSPVTAADIKADEVIRLVEFAGSMSEAIVAQCSAPPSDATS